MADPITLKGISFNGEKQTYLAPTWEEMGEYCFILAKKIIASGAKFDRLVTMASGGWTWAKTMADLLAIDLVGSIQVELYKDFVDKKSEPVLLQALPVCVKGEKVLVFDDVADTGETLKFCTQYLKMSGATKISSAMLFYKPWSIVKPDFYACQSEAWVIFPHELRESVDHIGKPWLKKGIKREEVLNRFAKIGLPKDKVEYYLNIKDQSAKIKT